MTAPSITPSAVSPANNIRRRKFRQGIVQNLRRFRTGMRVYAQNRLAMIGLVLIIIYALMAVAHPILMKTVWIGGIYNPETGYDALYSPIHPAPPSIHHLLGTDFMGRDILSRLLFSTQATFVMAILAALTTAATSVLSGALSAYYRGRVDWVLNHLAGAFLLLPAPIMMVILAVWTGDAFGAVGFGVGYGLIVGLGGAAIVMRSQALGLMTRAYIDAARVSGGGAWHIITRHLIPQMLPLASIQMMTAVAGVVIADGFISWVGVGTNWNRLNWGSMIMWAKDFSGVVSWHVAIPPALAISLFAAAFYLVSLGLEEIYD